MLTVATLLSLSFCSSARSMCRQSDIKAAKPVSTTNARELKALYVLTTFLCLFMVAWIGVFPSSWLMGRSDWHDRIINKTLVETYDGTSVSPRTVTKYAGHGLVQFTHIAPGAIWAGAIPFQLHPNVRRQYRWAHKMTGYAFVVSALLMAFGICVIFARDLTFHNDYDGIPPPDDIELLQMKISTTLLTISEMDHTAYRFWIVDRIAKSDFDGLSRGWSYEWPTSSAKSLW